MIDLDLFREKLRTGTHTAFEGLGYQCILFWHDLTLTGAVRRLPQSNIIRSLARTYEITFIVGQQYQLLVHEHKVPLDAQLILQMGFMASVTQTVDVTCEICKICDIDNEKIKGNEYWLFRDRFAHVKTFQRNRSDEKDVFDIHSFTLRPTRPDVVRYMSERVAEPGYMIRSISLADIARLLQLDLAPLFAKILEKAEQRGGP